MSRTIFRRRKDNVIVISFFFIGFLSGLYYWQVIIGNYCSSFAQIPIPTRVPSFYHHFSYRTMHTCRIERPKIFLTIAVLSSFERLVDYLPAMLETWVLTTTIEIEIIIFLEEESSINEEFLRNIFVKLNPNIQSCLFIVKLKHVENDYPPQKKSFYAMKFLYAYYHQRTSWILRLDDNAYVNLPQLIPWLKSIDYQQTLYIGQGGIGRPNEPTLDFPPGKYFCMGGSGVILSQQTLQQLGPWLDQCLTKELRTNHEDVELGRCILTHVQIGCTNAYNSKILFYHHYGPGYSFGYDFTPSIISKALILHPINNRTTFRQIYSFYLRNQESNFQLSKWKPSIRETYVTFVNSMEFDLVRDVHYQSIDARWRAYIQTTVQDYIDQLQKQWHQRSSNWTVINGRPMFGYHRVVPRYGLDLIVEMLFTVRSNSVHPAQPTSVRKRHHIYRPFVSKNRFAFREITNDEGRQLNLIVVSHKKDDALFRFIYNFEREILNNPERDNYFTLTILYFPQNDSIIDSIHGLTVRYPFTIRLVMLNQTENRYNRGLGRHLASQYFTTDELLFFLDVDLAFTGQALMNTRQLIIQQLTFSSCAAYFPIIYSFFSNIFKSNIQQTNDIQADMGTFSIYGFGNVAVRKGDLDRIGGWELNNYDWGIEDVNLFQRFVNLSIECRVFRAVEPGLRHYYHKKMCDGIQNNIRRKMCYGAEANLLESQANMVNYISDNEIVKD